MEQNKAHVAPAISLQEADFIIDGKGYIILVRMGYDPLQDWGNIIGVNKKSEDNNGNS